MDADRYTGLPKGWSVTGVNDARFLPQGGARNAVRPQLECPHVGGEFGFRHVFDAFRL